jgi:hypothetical protein
VFWNVFAAKPFAALSVLVCLATIASCISLKRRYMTHVADRFLVGFVGLLAIFQGLRIVQSLGLFALPSSGGVSDLVDLVVTLLYFQAPMVLRLSSYDRLSTDFELRLARAAPPKTAPLLLEPQETSRLDKALVDGLGSALSELPAPAFKLYAHLWLQSLQASSPEVSDPAEIGDQLIKLAASVAQDATPAMMPPSVGAPLAIRSNTAN